MDSKDILIIIDGHALIHRAYHAYPPNLRTTDGTLVNAAYGFTTMLLNSIKEFKPTYITCAFDLSAPTFRHAEFSGYKANRDEPDNELQLQVPIVKEVVRAFNIPIFEIEGYEADDIIGTISKKVDKSGVRVLIVTGDQDTIQLVDDDIHVILPGKRFGDVQEMDIEKVVSKYGFYPNQMIDYKALRGDPSDNIPGVKGIGEKIATDLIKNYHDLDNIYKNIDKLSDRLQKLLSDNQEEAYLSKKLATIDIDSPVNFDLYKCKLSEYDKSEVMNLFQKLEFRSLINRLPESTITDGQQSFFGNQVDSNNSIPENKIDIYKDSDYELVDSMEKLKEMVKKVQKAKLFAFDTETDGFDYFKAMPVGISISIEENQGYYIPSRIFLPNKGNSNNSDSKKAYELIKQIFEDEKIYKIAHHAKYDINIMKNIGVDLRGFYMDTMIVAFVAKMGIGKIGLKDLSFNYLGLIMEEFASLSKGKKFTSGFDIDEEDIWKYACRDADSTLRLFKYLSAKIIEPDSQEGFDKLYQEFKSRELIDVKEKIDIEANSDLSKASGKMIDLIINIEMPSLLSIIQMERNGIKLDLEFLENLSKELEGEINKIQKGIFDLVGHEFNLNSPKQLSEVLFEEIGIPKTKKLKSGGYTTNEAFLEKIKDAHPSIPLILDYREYFKLKSTFVDSFIKIAKANDEKVHTHYTQTIAVTGRLSSIDPNLQNIPIRTELGQQVRKAFIANKHCKLVGLDYSQQEMRILAHLSKDENLIDAFNNNLDIHTYTASKIYNKKIEEVNSEERRKAKTINFGIIYGISGFGLSDRLNISVEEGNSYIDAFFGAYPSIKNYYDELLENASKNGFVETMYGRRKDARDLVSGNRLARNRALREIINFPIQGSASEIVKLAMIASNKLINEKFNDARILLQIHDELVFEVLDKDDYIEEFGSAIANTMQNVVKLRVENKVDVHIGSNWFELK